MFSESDFENFLQAVRYKARKKAESRLKEAEYIYRIKLEEAHKKGGEYFEKEIDTFKRYLQDEKTRSKISIQMEGRRKENKEIDNIIMSVNSNIKYILKERFEDYLLCFSKWLKKNFKEGTVYTPEKWSYLFEGFDIKVHEEDRIIFEKGQIYISFSEEDIFRMLDEKIKTVVIKYING